MIRSQTFALLVACAIAIPASVVAEEGDSPAAAAATPASAAPQK